MTNRLRTWLNRKLNGIKVGKIEKLELSFGGMGNQWTTIDGRLYATWWDYKEGWKVGDIVEHKPFQEHSPYIHSRNEIIECTKLLRKVDAIKT